ncbi:hypothetical protein NBO_32g0011, partial [Nosema bombycis CQ1]
MKQPNIKEKIESNIMILGLIFLNIIFAKEGTLVPFKSKSLRITLMADNSVRFIDPKIYSGKNKSDSTIRYDPKKYRLYIGGDKALCKVDENSPIVSTCVDKVRFIDWKEIGEDVTRDDYTDDSEETGKKKKVQRMKSKTDPDLKVEPTDDELDYERLRDKARKNIVDFQRDVAGSKKEKDVLLTLVDKDHPSNKSHYKTNSTEMKRFLAGTGPKIINHDFVVDSGINASLLKE